MGTQTYDEMIIILSKLITLMNKTEDHDWSSFLENIKTRAINSNDKKETAREILTELYSGGMGSFLDLVLQKDMKFLIGENDQLEEYKEKLFQVCRKIIGENELKIKLIIENMILLLGDNNEVKWSMVFNEFLNKYTNADTRNVAVQEIINIYRGGMGSFTDLVLHKNAKMLIRENDQLAMLKDKLYETCIEYCKNNEIGRLVY